MAVGCFAATRLRQAPDNPKSKTKPISPSAARHGAGIALHRMRAARFRRHQRVLHADLPDHPGNVASGAVYLDRRLASATIAEAHEFEQRLQSVHIAEVEADELDEHRPALGKLTRHDRAEFACRVAVELSPKHHRAPAIVAPDCDGAYGKSRVVHDAFVDRPRRGMQASVWRLKHRFVLHKPARKAFAALAGGGLSGGGHRSDVAGTSGGLIPGYWGRPFSGKPEG